MSHKIALPSPLMRLTPGQDKCTTSRMVSISCGKNWWGTTKINRVAPLQASARLEKATTFKGRQIPGRYLMFSWWELMISDNFCLDPSSTSIVSSNTHKLTWELQFESRSQLRPTRMDVAEPKLPLPTMQTFLTCSVHCVCCGMESIFFFAFSDEAGRSDCCSEQNFGWQQDWCVCFVFDVADSCVECKWSAEMARVFSMTMIKNATLLHLLFLWYDGLEF